MSDDNKDLIALVASRPPEGGSPSPEPVPAPTVVEENWNAPIDMVHADSKTVTEIIKGEVAPLKEAAARWVPRPMPKDWYG